MDMGLWATWYDVDPADEEAFLAWTHDTYLPWLLQRPGITWAAHYKNVIGGETMQRLLSEPHRRGGEGVVPGGCAYVLLVGAPTSYTFYNPHVLDMDLPAGFIEQLAKRRNHRTEFYAEEARVDGCAVKYRLPGQTSAPCIQFGLYTMNDIEAEFALSRWYSQERLPLVSTLDCVVRTRKLVSSVGWAKHAILYEFASVERRLKEYEEPHESKTMEPNAWTGKIANSVKYPPGSPFVGERIWPPVE